MSVPAFAQHDASNADVLARIDDIYARQQARKAAVGATGPAGRREKLRRLERALLAHRQEIRDAVWADFRKPPEEADLSEFFSAVSEIRHALRHLAKWMKPKRVGAPLFLLGTRSTIVPEPKGSVLILAPWNFPINLAIGPLVSAVAAGNCAALKPSELTPATSALTRKILAGVFDDDEVAVIEGDATVAEALLQRRWDHIFFTGSTAIGRIVMKAAAEHLTPVTLELGGKSPAIVDATADLDETALKLAWSKLLNAGQICIAPDYVLVEKSVERELLGKIKASIARLTGDSPHPAIASIVSDRHFRRLSGLVDGAVSDGAEIVLDGPGNPETRYFAPTVLRNVSEHSAVMREEIFGPVLPVLTWESLDDAIRFVNERERPLAVYVFSRNRAAINRVVRETRAGGGCVNEAILQFQQSNLPFGGVQASGFGKAHGVWGFEAFSNMRGVLEQPSRLSLAKLTYPPFTNRVRKLIDLTVKWF